MMLSRPRSARWLPPTGVTPAELLHETAIGMPVKVLDVRELELFRNRHLEDAVHAPDSKPADLLAKTEKSDWVVMVCDDGRLSMMVARTLKFSGLADPRFLIGGLKAWSAAGGKCFQTGPDGAERPVVEASFAERAASRLGQLGRALTERVLFMALAGAAVLVTAALLVIR